MSMSSVNAQHPLCAKNTRKGSAWEVMVNTSRVLARRLKLMYDVYGERRQMRNMSDEMLSDLGITRAQLTEECGRGIADIPNNRN